MTHQKLKHKKQAHAPHSRGVARSVSEASTTHDGVSLGRGVAYGIAFAFWTVAMFMSVQYLIAGSIWAGMQMGITLPFRMNETALQTVLAVMVYIVTTILAIGLPWKILGQKLTLKDLGLGQILPTWKDIGLAPVALIASGIATGIVVYVVSVVLPGVDMTTPQQVGFENVTQRYEMLLAFFTLVVLAPVCEELLFRGYLYGRVRKYYTAFWAIVLTSVVFGAMHVYAGPGLPLQWNAMIATTVLAVFIAILREYTGGIWAGILVHMLKNAIAFFVLFVAPLLGISLTQ